MSWKAALIGGGLSGLGNWLGAKEQRKAQESANRTNKEIARDANTWQERLSNTAYQRQMKDLEAAGLNPMLAMNLAGASVPSAKTAHMAAVPSPKSAAVKGMLEGAQLATQYRTADASAQQAETQATVNKARVNTEAATAKQLNAATLKAQSEAALNAEKIKSESAKADFNKANYRFQKKNIEIDKRLEQFNKGMDLLNPLKKFLPNSGKNLNRGYNPRKHYKIDKATGEILN